MPTFNTPSLAALAALAIFGVSAIYAAQQPLVEPYLMSGKLSDGQTVLEKQIASHPDDDQARFGLGVLHFMQSVGGDFAKGRPKLDDTVVVFDYADAQWLRGYTHLIRSMCETILDGKKLLPFWRGTDATRGVNLHKLFHEPRDLDIVLWIHGSAAVPFLENGEVTDTATWSRFQRVYNGQLFTFAAWFN